MRWLIFALLPACFPLFPFRANAPPSPSQEMPAAPTGPSGESPEAIGVALSPSALTLHTNDRLAVTVTLTRPAGLDGAIALSLGDVPAGVTATLTPLAADSTTSVLSLSTAAITAAATTQLSVIASLPGAQTTAATLALSLEPSDRFIVSTSAIRVVRGQMLSFTADVVRDAAFSGAVTVSVAGVTSDLSGVTSQTLAVGETRATFSFASSGPQSPGAASLEVTATHAGLALPAKTIAITLRPTPGSPDGFRRDVFPDGPMIPERALAEASGSVLLLVSTSTTSKVIRLYRYGESGAPAEVAALDLPGDELLARDVKIDAQGRIYVLGVTDQGTGARAIYLARLSPDGVLDSTFGTGGVITKLELYLDGMSSDAATDIWPCTANAVFLRGGDAIVIGKGVAPGAGCEDPASTRTYAFAVDTNGDVIADYASGQGFFAVHPEAQLFNETIRAAGENAAGEVVIAGDTFHPSNSGHAQVYRLDTLVPPTLGLDSWANNTFESDPSTGGDTYEAVAAGPNGSWFAVGSSTRASWGGAPRGLTMRFAADATFAGQIIDASATALMTQLRSVTVASDGRAYVGGVTEDPQHQHHAFVARLGADVGFDPSFGVAGIAVVPHGLGDAIDPRVAIDTQQRLWVFAGIAGASELVAQRYFTE